jgi:hypothetical protein
MIRLASAIVSICALSVGLMSSEKSIRVPWR